jgi:hypothetical protein
MLSTDGYNMADHDKTRDTSPFDALPLLPDGSGREAMLSLESPPVGGNESNHKVVTVEHRGSSTGKQNKKVISLTLLKEDISKLEAFVKKTKVNPVTLVDLASQPGYPIGPDREDILECNCWITLEDRELLYERIAQSIPLIIAIHAIGISEITLRYWIRRASDTITSCNTGAVLKQCDVKYVEFIHSINRNAAVSQEILIRKINIAGYTDWKALAWLAERTYPNLFSGNAKVIINNSNSNSIDTQPKMKDVKSIVYDLSEYAKHFDGIDSVAE